MVDVARIGGVTGWLRAAGAASAHGIEMSSHLMPEISAHLLCSTPTAHWLEYVDWADAIIEEPLKIRETNGSHFREGRQRDFMGRSQAEAA